MRIIGSELAEDAGRRRGYTARHRCCQASVRHAAAGPERIEQGDQLMSKHLTISPNEAVDRLAIRELVEAYAHCADRRDAKGQMLRKIAGLWWSAFPTTLPPLPLMPSLIGGTRKVPPATSVPANCSFWPIPAAPTVAAVTPGKPSSRLNWPTPLAWL